VNFYGLTWSSGTEPIGLINTVRFVDDDPNRIYGIANLKEMDFSSSTWSATLVEVFDMDNDATGSPVARTLSLTANVGRVITYTKWDIISLADFTADAGLNKFTFAGSTSVTTTITCTLQGYTITTTSVPISVDIYLKKNATTLNTQTFTVTSNPESFNVTLTTSSVIIAPGDEIYVEMDSDITESQITGGILQITYNVTSAVSYDPYEDKYIYK
jgi:hypothetical protein